MSDKRNRWNPWRRNLTILVAEDDPLDAEVLKAAIKRTGIKGVVQFVKDGDEAIAYLQGEQVH